MGDLYVAPSPHACAPPGPPASLLFRFAARPPGSVWQCDDDECRELWEAVWTPLGSQWVRARDRSPECRRSAATRAALDAAATLDGDE